MLRIFWLSVLTLLLLCGAVEEVTAVNELEDVSQQENSSPSLEKLEMSSDELNISRPSTVLQTSEKESADATTAEDKKISEVTKEEVSTKKIGQGGSIFDHVDDERQSKPNLLLAIPLTLVAILLALHLWWPSTLRAGGPIAQIVVRILPSKLTQPPPFGSTGTLRWQIFTWLYDGQYNQPQNSTSSIMGGKKSRKSRLKGWWTGGGLGPSLKDNQDFVWVPSELSSVDVSDPNKPLPLSQVRSLTAHLHRMESDITSVGSQRPQPKTETVTMTELEFNILQNNIFESEEQQRLKLDRNQNETSWVWMRQFSIELKRSEEAELVRFLLTVTNEEEKGRGNISTEESEQWLHIRTLREENLFETLLEEERGRMRNDEDKNRINLVKQEVMTRKLMSESETDGILEVLTRPQRKLLANDEYGDRIEIEDSEAADRLYALQLVSTLLLSSSETCDRFFIAAEQLVDVEDANRLLIQSHSFDNNRYFSNAASQTTTLCEYLSESSFLVREERRSRGVLKSSFEAGKRIAQFKGLLYEIEINESEIRNELLSTAEIWSFKFNERFCRRFITVECRVAVKTSVSELMEEAFRFHIQSEILVRESIINEHSQQCYEYISLMTSEMKQLDALFAERREAHRKAVEILESEEKEQRTAIIIKESNPREGFAEEFKSSHTEAQSCQNARIKRETAEQYEVIKEEDFIRSEFLKAEVVLRTNFLSEERNGRDSAELMDFINSLSELESVIRNEIFDEENEERQQTRLNEHQIRQIIQEDLIRGRTKRASTGSGSSILRMECVADGAIVRAGVNLRTKQVAVLSKGEILHVIERKGNRGKVHEYGGWVSIQGQTGNIILREISEFKGELPPPSTPEPPAHDVPQESSPGQAESALKQVSSTWNKGWRTFSSTLSEVRLPGTPMPSKKTLTAGSSTTSASPEPRTPNTETSENIDHLPETPVAVEKQLSPSEGNNSQNTPAGEKQQSEPSDQNTPSETSRDVNNDDVDKSVAINEELHETERVKDPTVEVQSTETKNTDKQHGEAASAVGVQNPRDAESESATGNQLPASDELKDDNGSGPDSDSRSSDKVREEEVADAEINDGSEWGSNDGVHSMPEQSLSPDDDKSWGSVGEDEPTESVSSTAPKIINKLKGKSD